MAQEPLVVKYTPKRLSEIVGQKKAIAVLSDFVRNFERQKKRALLIHGPPGSGKTCVVYALAGEVGTELVQVNASDFRNREHIESKLGAASQQRSLFAQNKIILVDEVDGISGAYDRGCVGALVGVIAKTKFPIVLTATDPYIKKLKALRRHCTLLELDRIDSNLIVRRLESICSKEKVKVEPAALKKLALVANGDLRAAINDLQVLAQTKQLIKVKDVKLWGREQEENISDALKLIFKSFNVGAAMDANDLITEDLKILNFWLDENAASEYTEPGARQRAYDYLSFADIFLHRIIRWQYWRFMTYAKIFQVAGVQQAKKATNPAIIKYQRPALLLKLYIRAIRRKKMEAMSRQVCHKLHAGSGTLLAAFWPYYNFIKLHNKKMGAEIDEFLEIA